MEESAKALSFLLFERKHGAGGNAGRNDPWKRHGTEIPCLASVIGRGGTSRLRLAGLCQTVSKAAISTAADFRATLADGAVGAT